MTELKYRPDVDGLRAVAVLLVLLFHAGLGFSGGFVGVDVFFVISGYLITGLIQRQQRAGTFRLADFWGRRIRRILPASCAMVFITLAAGALLLFPTDQKELASSAAAQQLMLSNLFFWRHVNYFSGPSDLKPLLHTWSLSVEEQFYLAYPFLLVLLGRTRPRAVAGILGVAALASFALSEWGARNYPSAAFYLLPTRAWELLLGGLLCFLPAAVWTGRRLLAQSASLVGLAMILTAATCLDSMTRFPGMAALLPCLGAALLMHSNAGGLTWVGRLLSWKPVVGLGLISYSLYLWHWPLLAFARYWLGEHLPPAAVGTIIAASLLLAYLSWRFVETPFRRPTLANPRRVLIGLGASIPVVLVLAFFVMLGIGSANPASVSADRYLVARHSKSHSHNLNAEMVREHHIPVCGDEQGDIRCLVWGDSHAMAIMPGLDAACQSRGARVYQTTHSSTPPVLELVYMAPAGLNERAPAFSRAVVDFAITNDMDVAILCGVWRAYSRDPAFERQLAATIDELHAAGIAVAIILDVARLDQDAPLELARRTYFQLPTRDVGVPLCEHRARDHSPNAVIERLARGKAVVIDPAPCFVDDRGFWRAELDGAVLYRDQTHLSIEGGLRLRGLFEEMFDTLALAPSSRDGESGTRTAARGPNDRSNAPTGTR